MSGTVPAFCMVQERTNSLAFPPVGYPGCLGRVTGAVDLVVLTRTTRSHKRDRRATMLRLGLWGRSNRGDYRSNCGNKSDNEGAHAKAP